jgi:lipopolysaccharide/colanic/teichoic acid biosynthesis glycosyltransferase
MHFDTKSYLKSNRNHIAKQALDICFNIVQLVFFWCFLNYFYFKKYSNNILLYIYLMFFIF